MTTGEKDKLYIYVRVSTKEQYEKDYSIPRQKDLGIAKAKELGLDYEFYEEQGVSASNEGFENRPQLFRILELVKEGVIKNLFIFDQTRLSRNNITKAIISEELRKRKVQLYTHSKAFDFDKAEDMLTFKVLEALESYESSLRKARFAIGAVSANRKGKFLQPMPPFGYKKDDEGYLIVDHEEKLIFLEIVDLYINKSYGTNQIADYLNGKNIPTKSSKILKNGYTLSEGVKNRRFSVHKTNNSWNPGTIMTMLKNEIYYGKRRFKVGDGKYEYVEVEPLITEEAFKKIQVTRGRNAITKKKEDKYFYLLKNLCQCGNCGKPLHGRVKLNRGENTYRCNSKREKKSTCSSRGINISKLEQIVWSSYLRSDYYQNQAFDLFRKKLNDKEGLETRLTEYESALKKLLQDEKKLLAKKGNLLDLMIDPDLKDYPFDSKMKEIEKEAKLIEANKSTCILNIRNLKSQMDSKEDAENELEKWQKLYSFSMAELAQIETPFKSKKEQQKARSSIQKAIKNIVVTYYPDKRYHLVEIQFNLLPMVADPNGESEGYIEPGKELIAVYPITADDKSELVALLSQEEPKHFFNSPPITIPQHHLWCGAGCGTGVE